MPATVRTTGAPALVADVAGSCALLAVGEEALVGVDVGEEVAEVVVLGSPGDALVGVLVGTLVGVAAEVVATDVGTLVADPAPDPAIDVLVGALDGAAGSTDTTALLRSGEPVAVG